MTRDQFVARAIKRAEQALLVPAGWWGTWRDVTDGVIRVHSPGANQGWRITRAGVLVSRHDSRAFAISKARKL